MFLLFSFWAWSQEVQISGIVKSAADNLPLPGASVVIKGTVTGTTTDINGKYTIKASPKQVLVYSFIGMNAQEIAVTADSKNIDVVLTEAATMMQEVVVVGYGTQKKSVTTGAISGVKSKDIEKIPNGRIEQALQGKVSGVTIAANSGQPGSSSTINIRGITSFGDNNPLWVVDGVVIPADGIGNINQNDIASIEVLKDAASAAIYGTRAAAGVILVTTKKGQAGKMTVNYNTFYGTSAPANVLTLCNATQYATLINERQANAGLDIRFPNVSQYGLGTDWQKEIFNNNAMRFAHELSLTGGNDKSTYYASVALTSQEGIVISEISKYDKISIRLNSDHKISKVFTFGQTFGYTHTKSIGIGNTNSEYGGPLSSAINLDPITPVIVTDPVLASQSPYNLPNVLKDENGNPYGISPNVGQEMTNPLAYAQTRLGQYNWGDNFSGSAYLDINFTSKLKFRTALGANKAFWGWQGYTPVYYLNASTSNNVNSYGRSDSQGFDWNISNTLSYTNKIQDHEFTVLLGQEAYAQGVNGGGTSNTIQDLPITNYQDASFNFDIPQAHRVSSTWDFTEHKVASLFARANYNYQEKYMFTGIIRRDGSTRFGANYKYGIFPSFSLGWLVSKEGFWKTNDIVNSLKIRGGYGVNGSDNIGDFGYLSTVKGGFNYTLGNAEQVTTGYAPITLDNPDLHWEETSQLDIGFDARFLTNFNLVFDIYKKKTTGILRNIPIPGYVGVSSQPVGNVADMQNSGVELELGYNKTFGEVTFSAAGNIAYLKNEVTYVNSDADFIAGGAGFQTMGPVTRIQVGQSYNSFYGYKTDGIFQNMDEVYAYKNDAGDLIQPKAVPGDFKWTDTDHDGAITEADKQFLGSSIPKYTFGITLNAAYKGFDLMIFGQGAAGNKIFQGLRRLDIEYSNWQTVAMSRWTGEGTSNTYPRLTAKDDNLNFGNMSDFYLEKGDYFRMKQVQLGYTIKSDVLKKIDISRLRIYLQSENLFTITGYTGYDPQIGGGVYGIDKGFYPQARSFIAGLQLQF
jgi:TonB-linked SusC/RagA family outer membrane protein